MAVLRQAEAQRVVQDAIVLDLGDMRRQGDALRERASSDAAGILAQARAERERLLAGAREEGYAQGLVQGREAGLTQGRIEGAAAALAERRDVLAALERAWGAALTLFDGERDRMLLEARRDVLKLAVMLAERVIKRRIATDARIVESQIEAVLALLARPTKLVIAIHPEDQAVAAAALPSLTSRFPNAQHVELRTDAALERGSCVAQTAGGGVIDASIPTQLDRIVDALLPRETTAEPPPADPGAAS